MSECVVRMEMPSDCERCPMCGTESCGNGMYKLWCMCGDIPASSQRRPEDCPIICSLPEGHGRLVDADALFHNMFVTEDGNVVPNMDCDGRHHLSMHVEDVKRYICEAPTIVPAERSET